MNYEARTSKEPAEKKAKRKLKNYKLKHSRLLTCYSALLYLLAIFEERKTVSPKDALEMARLTPALRLEWLLKQPLLHSAHPHITKLLRQYEAFLTATDASEDVLVDRFLDKAKARRYFSSANEVGDSVFELLKGIGQKNSFHRLLVV